MKIAFIGLGIMGSRMAANLQKKGHSLIVHNRSRDRADDLLAAGAEWASSPAEAARDADILFTMLSTPEVVEEMALDKNGFLTVLKPGSLWVDCSTVSPSFSLRMASECNYCQVRFMDAPVAGSKIPAENGQLVFFVGGEAEDLEEVRPLLNEMGRAIIHMGGHSMGSAIKLTHNALMGMNMIAFVEALSLGQALGLEREKLFETLIPMPAMSPLVATKRAKIEGATYEPDFPLQWMRKDMHLSATAAYEKDRALPMVNLAKELYTLAVQRGLGEKDFSAIYQYMTDIIK